jgi:DNA-binding NtrC family response regulator
LITPEDLPALAGGAAVSAAEPLLAALLTMPLEQAVRELERILIARAIMHAGGNKTEAARLLQIRRQQLYARMSELGIE